MSPSPYKGFVEGSIFIIKVGGFDTLLKQKYVIHTKIGMIQEFTPRIPLFGVNNIPMGMYYIPSYKYVFHSYIRMLSILLKYVLHTFIVCNTYFKVCIASLK